MQPEEKISSASRLSARFNSQLTVASVFIVLALTTSAVVYGEVENHHDDYGNAANKSVEKTLIDRLLANYQTYGVIGRPVENYTQVIQVRFGLALIQILELDENKQILRTNCWCRYYWEDKLLNWNSWNSSYFDSIQQVRVFPETIWTPDIKLYNFADERLTEGKNARVVVSSGGSVLWIPQALFKSTCSVEITFFPYDTQTCVLKFGSWTYDISQMDLLFWEWDAGLEVPYIDFNNYVTSNEWIADGQFEKDVKNASQRRMQIKSVKTYRKVRSVDEKGRTIIKNYAVLEYKVRLARNPGFLVAILIVPCILLSCLTLVLFWLPPEAPAKMMLGINIFVAFFILLLLLAESTPSAVKTFPLIGIFYCFNMILITLSTFLSVIVINLYFRSDKHGSVPPLVRRILLDGLGRLLCVYPSLSKEQEKVRIFKICGEKKPEHRVKLPRMKFNKYENQVSGDGLDGVASGRSSGKFPSKEETMWHQDSPIMIPKASGLERDVREIKRYISLYVSRQRDKDRRSKISVEWRTLALVLDRIFFIVYFITLITSIILLLPRRNASNDFEYQYYRTQQQGINTNHNT